MTAPKQKYTPSPRGWTLEQVATRLGVSISWFQERRKSLYEANFPRPDALTGRTDSKALERWMDMRSGLVDQLTGRGAESGSGFDEALRRVRGLTHGTGHA